MPELESWLLFGFQLPTRRQQWWTPAIHVANQNGLAPALGLVQPQMLWVFGAVHQ